jgi:hypothetical protein
VIRSADLVIVVLDASEPTMGADAEALAARFPDAIVVSNKMDRPGAVARDGAIRTSAVKGAGVERVAEAMLRRFGIYDIDVSRRLAAAGVDAAAVQRRCKPIGRIPGVRGRRAVKKFPDRTTLPRGPDDARSILRSGEASDDSVIEIVYSKSPRACRGHMSVEKKDIAATAGVARKFDSRHDLIRRTNAVVRFEIDGVVWTVNARAKEVLRFENPWNPGCVPHSPDLHRRRALPVRTGLERKVVLHIGRGNVRRRVSRALK